MLSLVTAAVGSPILPYTILAGQLTRARVFPRSSSEKNYGPSDVLDPGWDLLVNEVEQHWQSSVRWRAHYPLHCGGGMT